jgi:hypothetical protein
MVKWVSGIYGVRPGGIASGDLREGPRLANVVAERRPAMLSIHEHPTVQDASSELLSFILDPVNWVALETVQEEPRSGPRHNAAYQRQVGKLRICAAVEVTPSLDVFLRIGFSAPGLTPMRAADHLEAFLGSRLPLVPNSEWQVAIDGRRWVHFIRRYALGPLRC